MKSVKPSGILGLAIFAVLASPFAMADDPSDWDTGWYLGGNLGQSRSKIGDVQITNTLLGAGFTTTSISDRKMDTGYKLFAGYEFNRYFSIEGGYFDLGKFGFTAATLPAGTLTGQSKVNGWNIDLVGFMPFTENLSGFARLGLNDAKADDTFSGTGFVNVVNPNPSQSSANYKFGLGLQYDFTPSFGMRLEDERYRINDGVGNKGDVDLISLGVVLRFGRGSPAPTRQAANPPPAYVPVQKAVLGPVWVVVPVAAPTQQYCSILDIQFAINQDDIRSVMNEKLGVVGTFMNKYPNSTAVIEGHTDNVGTEADNMTLSQARAQSVVDYLESDQHIDASRLSAVGYGETRPIADNSTQEGQRQNRRIDAVIACAQDVQGLTVKPARVTMALRIDYDKDKSEVKPQYHDDLQQVANFLKANPAVTALVQGNTANTQATPELAMQISVDRAQNVVNYLVDNFGIARARLTAQGFGGNRRFAYNTSVEGQAENRRVNIIIIYPN